MNKIFIGMAMSCLVSLSVFAANPGLQIKDSTFNNGSNTIPVYVIRWSDNAGKSRTVLMTKTTVGDNYPGICVLLKYYDQNNALVTVASPTPSDVDIHNRGFGGTVHHIQTGAIPWIDQGTNLSLTIRSQGVHHAIIDFVQTIDGAIETVTYTFLDGLDYFQWQETVQCNVGTKVMDSRGPYCTMDWDGNGAFDAIDGQEYGAQKYLVQPSFTSNNGAYTFGGTCDIPYVQQWKGGREIGYVQTQTFTQQLAGSPEFSAANIPAVGNNSTLSGKSWALDFQMNIYDQLQKITWGMPYGYMEGVPAAGLTSTGTKNGYGQYSLSIVFDALTTAGVKRVMNENRLIQNGSVTLSASMGSVVTSGPVGTKNPTLQTLSPAGFDHNYRTWWLQSNGSDQVQVTMNVANGLLKNPTFRVKNMTQVPNDVTFNSTLLTPNVDYYASFDAITGEAWVTLLKNVSGSNTILIQGNTTGITIFSTGVNPNSVSNNSASNVTFSVTASASGTIANVTLDLASLGGSNLETMSLSGVNNYTFNYTIPQGVATGVKTVNVIVSDQANKVHSGSIPLTISSGIVFGTATVNPSSFINNVVTPIIFNVDASDDGSIVGIKLDLTPIGGGNSVSMVSGNGNVYTYNYNAPAGILDGIKQIIATATDNQGNELTIPISLNVKSSVTLTSIYSDGPSLVCSGCTYGANGSLTERSNQGAQEGIKDFLFTYTVAGYYAGFGMSVSNWGAAPQDFTSQDSLQIAYKGPVGAGTGLTVKLSNAGNVSSNAFQMNLSANYKVVKIPLSYFTGVDKTRIIQLDFAITGVQTGVGSLQIDNVQLIKKFVSTVTEVLEATEAGSDLMVIPNPVQNGKLRINKTENNENACLYNSSGHLVQRGIINAEGWSVNHLPSGIYFLVIGSQSQKVVVE